MTAVEIKWLQVRYNWIVRVKGTWPFFLPTTFVWRHGSGSEHYEVPFDEMREHLDDPTVRDLVVLLTKERLNQ